MESEQADRNLPDVQGDHAEDKTMKGAAASLGILAAVIVVMWIGVYWIYMSRV